MTATVIFISILVIFAADAWLQGRVEIPEIFLPVLGFGLGFLVCVGLLRAAAFLGML